MMVSTGEVGRKRMRIASRPVNERNFFVDFSMWMCLHLLFGFEFLIDLFVKFREGISLHKKRTFLGEPSTSTPGSTIQGSPK